LTSGRAVWLVIAILLMVLLAILRDSMMHPAD
jgi:hypothetical protein